MNTLSRTVALALVAALGLPALAQTSASPTRAEVIAELQRARASGELARMNSEDTVLFGQPVVPPARSTLATKDAAKPAVNAEPAQPATPAASASRDAVKAELLRARQAGEMDFAQAELGPRLNGGAASKLPADPVLAGQPVQAAK
ncbi:DUF4148 domain-containing protein [Pelomonas sp. APW6]|uniref:DUF4148 domain-containing protein n=1 Tax=Roseateles subflavus TaxID=3053353 RepID=A0ABT7LJ00_9BURK|nr:DUF4148 domain-containing protein [Pelomonas sp. APW6]MDL5032841.1 DUF4148 domain-containing protein [Pelomonas sp. APW6]